jgi:NTP pyrophosphatase (non-canonical NTP hydrolase)
MTTAALRETEVNHQAGGITVNEYQNRAYNTAVYPGQGTPRGVEYALFGALGELGEIANKYKKILRSEQDVYAHAPALMDEAGDAVWYIMAFLRELGYTFEQAAQFNLGKLAARQATGTLKDHK